MSKGLQKTVDTLLIAGAINWGLVLFNLNVVTLISETIKLPVLETIVYAGIGLAGLAKLFKLKI